MWAFMYERYQLDYELHNNASIDEMYGSNYELHNSASIDEGYGPIMNSILTTYRC
jgi:hypothetical protein